MLSKERIIEIGKRYFKEGHNPDSVPFFVAAAEDCIKEALRAQADAGSKMHDAATLDAAITIVCNARDALGAGTEFPYDAQERSTVGPYLDGIEDKLRALYDTHSSAPAAQALSDGEIQALWNEACHDTTQKPGWCRHIRFARSIESAILTRSAATVAEPSEAPGFVLVPLEPTAQMRKAAADAWLDCDSRMVLNKAAAALKAGIAAAAKHAGVK